MALALNRVGFCKAIVRRLKPDSTNSQLGILGVIVGVQNARSQPSDVAFEQAVQNIFSR